jgi:predicted lactoylglutathione lyase
VLATQHARTVDGFHIALVARSRSEVDAFHAAALLLGGTSELAPGPRLGYYATFVRDPDGLRLEALCYG